jgi:hypothetical protein
MPLAKRIPSVRWFDGSSAVTLVAIFLGILFEIQKPKNDKNRA